MLQQVVGPCRVAGNALSGLSSGIIVNGQISDSPQPIATDVIVAKNVVVCSPAPGATGDAAGARVFGIDLAAHTSIVSHNLVALPAPSAVHTGIRVTGDNVDVIDNQVAALPGPAAPTGAVGGAFTGIQAGETSALTTDVKVAGNFVSGGRIGISAKSATGAIIDGNIVEIAAAQNVVGNGITLVAVKGGQVGGNRINGNGIAIGTTNGTTNRLTGNTLSSGLLGVLIGTEVLPVVAQNRIDGMSAGGILCGAVTGGCEIVENRITSCGFGGNPGAGILVTQINGELHIEANQITDTGLSPDRATIAALAHGISGTLTLEATIENNYVGYTDPSKRPVTNEDRALAMSCLQEVRTTPLGDLGFPIQVLGNKFIGPGKSALVEIQEQAGTGDVRPRFERVTFSNNYCLHYPDYTAGANTPRTVSTVSLFGRFGIVMGNQIKAIRPPATNIPVIASVNFNGMPGPFIGNITSGDVLQHTQFPSPQTGFNLIA